MSRKSRLGLLLAGWVVLMVAGLLSTSCVSPYYYDRYHHRIWRDGHDDEWHRAHGDHWEEWHGQN